MLASCMHLAHAMQPLSVEQLLQAEADGEDGRKLVAKGRWQS